MPVTQVGPPVMLPSLPKVVASMMNVPFPSSIGQHPTSAGSFAHKPEAACKTVQVKFARDAVVPSFTVTVTVYGLVAAARYVSVPLIRPEVVLMFNPFGSGFVAARGS